MPADIMPADIMPADIAPADIVRAVNGPHVPRRKRESSPHPWSPGGGQAAAVCTDRSGRPRATPSIVLGNQGLAFIRRGALFYDMWT